MITCRIGKLILAVALLAIVSTVAGLRADEPSTIASRPLKILAVGNSFTRNAVRFFPEIVKAAEGKQLVLGIATVGGGPLDQHWRAVVAHEADPSDAKGRIYRGTSLKEKLREQSWDFVTIQQNSFKSRDISTFRPFAENLATYIREHAPDAKIMIHQTWAYRVDDPLFEGDYSQVDMYRDLTNAYQTIAKEISVERIIPVGRAFQEARSDPAWRFTYPDSEFDYKQPIFPRTPRQEHSLNNGWSWTPTKRFRFDGHHANAAGEYLGAAVWFEFFFGADVRGNHFVPSQLNEEDVEILQGVAHHTVTVRASEL